MYVVLSGNTGAGKSTLGRAICSELAPTQNVEYVDERELHHELVQQMFDTPRDYAFLIQMNFLLQRTLKIKHMLDAGKVFLMERSLAEDFLFAQRHLDLGNMTDEEFCVYEQFWKHCTSMVPTPSVYIYLRADDPSVLVDRIVNGYTNGIRKKELPDDKLEVYASEMNALYTSWFAELGSPKATFPVCDGPPQENADFTSIVEVVHSAFTHKR